MITAPDFSQRLHFSSYKGRVLTMIGNNKKFPTDEIKRIFGFYIYVQHFTNMHAVTIFDQGISFVYFQSVPFNFV